MDFAETRENSFDCFDFNFRPDFDDFGFRVLPSGFSFAHLPDESQMINS